MSGREVEHGSPADAWMWGWLVQALRRPALRPNRA